MISKRKLIFIILLGLTAILSAEARKITVKGSIYDRLTTKPLPHVKINILKSDSTTAAETEAFKKTYQIEANSFKEVELGDFSFDVEVLPEPYTMRLEKEGYEILTQVLDLSKVGKREFELAIPPIYMTPQTEEKTTELDEFVVKATKIKFYHKGDTIVYNADAFMLPEGSSLDALIAKLPGVEIKEGGKIYVNGKYVESLLLNGKDFFKGNQDVLRQNIGAYSVKDIAVYDKYGQMSNLMGTQLEDDKEYVMDVRLKKDYMGGFLGNAEVGYGTHGRYSGRLFAMHFNNNARFSVYGNLNNVNDTDRPNDGEGYSFSSGSPDGISNIANGGFDYMVEDPRKVWSINGNIDAKYFDNKLSRNTFTESFLQSGNTYMTSLEKNRNMVLRFDTEHSIKYNKPLYYLSLRPTFCFNRTKTQAGTSAVTFNTDIQDRYDVDMALIEALYKGTSNDIREAIVNRNRFDNKNRTNNYRAYFWSEQAVKFAGSPDALNFWIEGEYNRDHSSSSSLRVIDYGFNGTDAPATSDAYKRDDLRFPAYNGFIKGAARYFVKSRNTTFTFGYEFRHEQERKTSLQMLLDSRAENEEAILPTDMALMPDLPNTNNSKRYANIHMLKASFDYTLNNDKIRFNLSIQPQFHINNRHLFYNAYQEEGNGMIPVMIPVTRTAASFNSSKVILSFRVPDNKYRAWLSYNFDTRYAPLTDLIDLPNTTDPLNKSHGNPNLKDAFNHNIYLSLGSTPAKNTNLYLWGQVNYISRDIVNGYTYNPETGVRDYEARNVSGNLRTYYTFQGAKSFGPENHQFSVRANIQYEFNRYANLIGENGPINKQVVYSKGFGYSASLEYTLMSKYTLSCGIYANNTFSKTNSPLIGNTLYRHTVPYAIINLKLPYKLSVMCKMSYIMERGSANKEMNFNQCILLADLQYQLNSRWTFKLHGYDLLNQMHEFTNTISASGRVQTFVNTLPRYVMLSVTYKFNTKKR